MRALLDKQEYVGGGDQMLHVRFLSKQLGDWNVKIIGRPSPALSESLRAPARPG